jgi:hypothetical protein
MYTAVVHVMQESQQTDFSEVASHVLINLFKIINKGIKFAGVGAIRRMLCVCIHEGGRQRQ